MTEKGMLLAENANSKLKQYFCINKLYLKSIESIHFYIAIKVYAKMAFFNKKADYINAKNIKANKRSFSKAIDYGKRNFLYTEKQNNFEIITPNKNNCVKIPLYFAYFLIKYTNKKLPGKYYAYFTLFYLIAQELNLSQKRYFRLTINEILEKVKITKPNICNFFNIYFPGYSIFKVINLTDLYNAFKKYENEVINYNPADQTKPKPKTKNSNITKTNNIAKPDTENIKESIMEGIEKHNNTKPNNNNTTLDTDTKTDIESKSIMQGIMAGLDNNSKNINIDIMETIQEGLANTKIYNLINHNNTNPDTKHNNTKYKKPNVLEVAIRKEFETYRKNKLNANPNANINLNLNPDTIAEIILKVKNKLNGKQTYMSKEEEQYWNDLYNK